jgi:hypothetical protein
MNEKDKETDTRAVTELQTDQTNNISWLYYEFNKF